MNKPASLSGSPDISGDYRLLGVSTFRMAHREARGPNRQRPWLLELYVQGALEVNVDNSGWHHCPTGTGMLYPPGTPFLERVPMTGQALRPCQSIALFFEMADHAALNQRLGRAPRHRFIEDPDGLLRGLANTILQHHGSDAGGELMAQGCFYQALASLVMARTCQRQLIVRDAPSAPPDLVTAVHRYMREHLADPLRIADVAKHMRMSESGLSHAYRRLAGRSPMTSLRRMRVEAVQVYLLSNRLTLAQIAERTGFADAFHLSRTFKQVTGLTPQAYRKRAGHD